VEIIGEKKKDSTKTKTNERAGRENQYGGIRS